MTETPNVGLILREYKRPFNGDYTPALGGLFSENIARQLSALIPERSGPDLKYLSKPRPFLERMGRLNAYLRDSRRPTSEHNATHVVRYGILPAMLDCPPGFAVAPHNERGMASSLGVING